MRKTVYTFILGLVLTASFIVTQNQTAHVQAATVSSGEDVYKGNCMACHGVDGKNGRAPELVGGSFTRYFKSVGEAKQYIQKTMPANAPGSLTDEQYQAVAEYLWKANGGTTANTPASTEIQVLVDGKKLSFPVAPRLVGGTTLVPLREIFQALGAEVAWDQKTKTVTATKGSTVVTLTIGQKFAFKGKQKITLAVPAQVVQGRTLVPLRFVSEALGSKVDWNGAQRIIAITR